MGGRGAGGGGKYGNSGGNTIAAKNATQIKGQAQTQAQQQTPQKEPKVSKKQAQLKKLTDYISQMVSVDISKYHEESFDGKGYVTLDWKRMPKSDKSKIENLANQYNHLEIVDYGAWGKWIKYK